MVSILFIFLFCAGCSVHNIAGESDVRKENINLNTSSTSLLKEMKLSTGCYQVDRKTRSFLTDAIHDEFIKFETSSIVSSTLQLMVDKLCIPEKFFRKHVISPIQSGAVCVIGAAVSEYVIIRSRKTAISPYLISNVLIEMCILFRIEASAVCKGFIESNIDTITYIARENKDLNGYKVAAILLQKNGCYPELRPTWAIEIPSGVSRTRLNIESEDSYKIVHLTDLHMDPLYKAGTSNLCDNPLCCQQDQPEVSNPEERVGEWGDYNNCDMPYKALYDLLQQVSQQKRTSYIYFTGDVISHRVWDTSRDLNTREIKRVYRLFKNQLDAIPIYPVLGNHEAHPVNIFAPLNLTNELSTSWLYEVVAVEWLKWLPAKTLTTILKGGYYTVLVKPGFRIVALNSNVCMTYNWWLLYDSFDPYGQLTWLVQVLKEAEEVNESVHILSHVPPGDTECLQEWTHQYHRIVERFSNTITGQFNGHTHYDEFRAFYNNQTEVIAVAYNGGSFTTYNNLNPNYKVFEVNAQSHELLDYEEWTYDLEEANRNSTPAWYKLYNFRTAYNVDSLKPKDLQGLLVRIKNDMSIWSVYNKYKVRSARPFLLQECLKDCQNLNICLLGSTEADEAIKCDPNM